MISSIPKWVTNLVSSSMLPNVKVLDVSAISPQIKRIRFQGNISKWHFVIGYACVIRVSETEFRNYTIAHYNMQNETFDIIFHIHGNGVGSRYIDNLKIGDEIFIGPPRGKKLYNKSGKQQLFFGDETSFGVASALLPLLKDNNQLFQFYFELDHANRNVPEQLGLENFTVFPKDNFFRNEKLIENLPVFQTKEWGAAYYILVGNAKSVQSFRKALKKLAKVNVYSQGYWLEGKKGL